MRKNLGILVAGVVLGIMIYRFADRSRVNDLSPQLALREEKSAAPNKDVQSAPSKRLTPLQLVNQQAIIQTINGNSSPIVRAPANIQSAEKTLGLRIEENTVDELEEEGEVLRQHASAEQRDDGWQIHIFEEDRALLQAGLRDGDVITQDSLNSQFRTPDRTVLVGRFVALLKYIER